MTPPQYAV
jgi:uncharacterized coiled-coil protein SlyX